MAYYSNSPMKFHGVHPPAPASPMPSYQSSSQSETTTQSSPGGANSSFSSHVTPSWATPTTPHSYHTTSPPSPPDGSPTGAMVVVTPPSPGFSESSDDLYSHGDETSQRKSIRESRANTRALSLLDSTAGSDVRVRALSAPHVSAREQSMPNYHSRTQANQRALDLLNATCGGDVEASATFLPSNLPGDQVDTREVDERVKDHKGSMDKVREREANIRALALLDATVGCDVSATARMASDPLPKSSTMTKQQHSVILREAAIVKYKEKKRMQANLRASGKPVSKPAPAAPVVKQDQEALAESSRKIAKAAEDFRDPETVAGMKGQLDVEREERAKKRALQIMKYGMMA